MNLLPLPETLVLLAADGDAIKEARAHFNYPREPGEFNVVCALALNYLWRRHRGADRRDLQSCATLIARLATGGGADPFGTQEYPRERWAASVLEAACGGTAEHELCYLAGLEGARGIWAALVIRLADALYFTQTPGEGQGWRSAVAQARECIGAARETHPNSSQLLYAEERLTELLAKREVTAAERRRLMRAACDAVGRTRHSFTSANAAEARRILASAL